MGEGMGERVGEGVGEAVGALMVGRTTSSCSSTMQPVAMKANFCLVFIPMERALTVAVMVCGSGACGVRGKVGRQYWLFTVGRTVGRKVARTVARKVARMVARTVVAASQCRKQAGVNNDLWLLDASTGVWKNIFENDASVAVGGTSPVGREGHSASKMGDRRSSCSAGRPFRAGTQWEPGRTSSWETCGS